MTTYYTFLRSAKNWREFAGNEKRVVETGLSYDEAREACQEYNANRSEREKEEGTYLEFTEED